MTDLFELPGVAGWEVRLQATFIAPLTPSDAGLPSTFDEVPSPRANLVVSRVETAEADAMAAYRTFLDTTAGLVPGLEVVSDVVPFAFDDGASGVAAVVSFPATEQISLMQLHVFRLDARLLTQIVATIDAVEGDAALHGLSRVIAGFAPRDRDESVGDR